MESQIYKTWHPISKFYKTIKKKFSIIILDVDKIC